MSWKGKTQFCLNSFGKRNIRIEGLLKKSAEMLCSDYENGSLKMKNAFDMQNPFIIKWVKNIYCNKYASYSCIPVMYYEKLGYDFSVLRSSVKSKHFTGFEEIQSQYWKKALEIWLNQKMNKNDNTLNIDEVDDIAMQPLWNNVLVQHKGKSLFYKGWIESGWPRCQDALAVLCPV